MSDHHMFKLSSLFSLLNQDSCDSMARKFPVSTEHVPHFKNLIKFFSIIDAIANHELKGKTILDIGCGLGILLVVAKHLGMSPIGIDAYTYEDNRSDAEAFLISRGFSKEDIGSVIRKHDIARPLPADLIGQFDFAISLGVLEHIPDSAERHAAVTNMVSSLGPGGTLLLVAAPNILFPIDFFHYKWYPFYHCLSEKWKTRYMKAFISHTRYQGFYRDTRFLSGLRVTDISKTIENACPGIEVLHAFPMLSKMAVSRHWMRNTFLRGLIWQVSRLLTSMKIEPILFFIAKRPYNQSDSTYHTM